MSWVPKTHWTNLIILRNIESFVVALLLLIMQKWSIHSLDYNRKIAFVVTKERSIDIDQKQLGVE